MRTAIFLYLFLVSIASAETITKPTLIISDELFTQGGTLKTTTLSTIDDPHKTENGILNGVNYEFFYTDGSGRFVGTKGNTLDPMEHMESNWSTQCKKDPITDSKMCSMNMKNLWVYVYGNGKAIVSIGYEHFPGSSVIIRIDGGTPMTISSAKDGNFPGNTSAKIIGQLKQAKSLTTRYMKWPYQTWIDESWELYGFNEAFQYINWAVGHIN